MTSMTRTTVGVTGGVDTHGQSHHAAVIDHLGRRPGDREFPHRRWVIAPWWSGCKATAGVTELALRAPAPHGHAGTLLPSREQQGVTGQRSPTNMITDRARSN